MSDNLQFNMIAGAGLAAVLGLMGLGVATDAIFASHYPEKPGYEIEVAESGSGPEQAGPPKPIDWGGLYGDTAQLTALVDKGQRVAGACKACHIFEQGGANGTGPGLYGIVGRVSGTHGNFAYSDAMKKHAAPWTYEELNHFVAGPAKYIPGTKMTFAGVRKEEDRVALIAYLRSLAPTPASLPPALPPEASAPAAAPAAPAAPPPAAPPAH
jgi:cytochrome c